MKFENNNKEIIKKITNRSLKSNKTRNIFVVIAIVLTTFMLACVFTLGISFNENYQLMNLRDAFRNKKFKYDRFYRAGNYCWQCRFK